MFNTFFALYSLDDQVRCMRNVAAHLEPGGRFLMNVFVPDLSRIEQGQNLGVREAALERVRLDATVFDAASQRLDVTQIRITEQGIRLVHSKLRYAFPTELDLMAQLAGLTLEQRWSSFDKQPFTEASAWNVAVYRA